MKQKEILWPNANVRKRVRSVQVIDMLSVIIGVGAAAIVVYLFAE